MTKVPPAGANGVSPRNYSPRRQHVDAQKYQIDLTKAFDELRIRDVEVEKLYAYQRRLQREEADLRESTLAKAHDLELERAKQDRDARCEEARAALLLFYEKQEEERRRREEEEKLRQQREAQAKAERDRKIREEQERLRREAEERARAEAERQRQEKERAELAEKERQRKEEEWRQQEEQKREAEVVRREAEAEAQRKAEKQAQTAATAQASTPEKIHKEYTDLYFRIKEWKNKLWADLMKAAKQPGKKEIKEAVANARRLIKSEVGKLSPGEKTINKVATDKLKEELRKLVQQPIPEIGSRIPVNFFLPPSLQLDDNNQTLITDQAAYFLAFLAQQIVKIFTSYVHGAPERAEPIGVMLTSLFAQPEIQYTRQGSSTPQKQSLFPIVIAKYHRVCPALFGVTGPQSTATGKRKVGWALLPVDDESQPKTTFVSDQTHYDRMTGLAIGYSSFALRNFAAVANTLSNPYPPLHFWKSLAQIINLPPDQVQPTHVCVLRYMFGHGGIGRFLLFFGSVGVAVLREAFVEFPNRLPESIQTDSYVRELRIFAERLGQNEHLHLP